MKEALMLVRSNYKGTQIVAKPIKGLRAKSVKGKQINSHCQCDCACESPGEF